MIHWLATGRPKPSWMPSYIWHPLTWLVHGILQRLFYLVDPFFGWGMLSMWYYRDRYADHRGNPPSRWPLDGIMDVLVPILVQVYLFWR